MSTVHVGPKSHRMERAGTVGRCVVRGQMRTADRANATILFQARRLRRRRPDHGATSWSDRAGGIILSLCSARAATSPTSRTSTRLTPLSASGFMILPVASSIGSRSCPTTTCHGGVRAQNRIRRARTFENLHDLPVPGRRVCSTHADSTSRNASGARGWRPMVRRRREWRAADPTPTAARPARGG